MAIISLPEELNVTSHETLLDEWCAEYKAFIACQWSSLLLILVRAGQQQQGHTICPLLGLPLGQKGNNDLTSTILIIFCFSP